MEKITVKVKKLNNKAKIPIYGTNNSAGFDFFAMDDFSLKAKSTAVIETGIAMEIPEGHALQIWDRGGMGVKGIHRFSGLIDSDYRGEIKIVLHNSNDKIYNI